MCCSSPQKKYIYNVIYKYIIYYIYKYIVGNIYKYVFGNFIDVKGYWISLYLFSSLQYTYVSSRHLVLLLLCLINCSLLDIINKMDAHGIWNREGINGPVVRLWHNCYSFGVRKWSCVIGSASYMQTVSGVLTSRQENNTHVHQINTWLSGARMCWFVPAKKLHLGRRWDRSHHLIKFTITHSSSKIHLSLAQENKQVESDRDCNHQPCVFQVCDGDTNLPVFLGGWHCFWFVILVLEVRQIRGFHMSFSTIIVLSP